MVLSKLETWAPLWDMHNIRLCSFCQEEIRPGRKAWRSKDTLRLECAKCHREWVRVYGPDKATTYRQPIPTRRTLGPSGLRSSSVTNRRPMNPGGNAKAPVSSKRWDTET